jgi:hypothetical protein
VLKAVGDLNFVVYFGNMMDLVGFVIPCVTGLWPNYQKQVLLFDQV